jgi:pyruvate ferredoxin oxidoreductase alpha subunit
MALAGTSLHAYTVVAGLGGRAITKASLRGLFEKAEKDALEPLTFLDLNHEVVNREIEREKQQRRSGPTAENVLRQLGTVASTLR